MSFLLLWFDRLDLLEHALMEDIHRHLNALGIDSVEKMRAHAARLELAEGIAVIVNTQLLEPEKLMQANHIPFHAGDFNDPRYLSLSARQTLDLNQKIVRRSKIKRPTPRSNAELICSRIA